MTNATCGRHRQGVLVVLFLAGIPIFSRSGHFSCSRSTRPARPALRSAGRTGRCKEYVGVDGAPLCSTSKWKKKTASCEHVVASVWLSLMMLTMLTMLTVMDGETQSRMLIMLALLVVIVMCDVDNKRS